MVEVADSEDGRVIHYLEAPLKAAAPGTRVHGKVDALRRRDHMQQHSGQHVLSAAFIRLFNLPTVSFHMADDYCSIDLDTPTLTKDQIETAERSANEIILENHLVDIRFVSREEAGKLGLRKLPPAERDELRIVDIREVDVSACGGTHVNQTGQIGCILVRKAERVRQGWRVEFVAGQRAVATARRDFTTLTEAGGLFSAHIYDVPQQARKSLDEVRNLRKQVEQSMEDLATAQAAMLLAETPESNGRRVVVQSFFGPRHELAEASGSETDPPLFKHRRRCSRPHPQPHRSFSHNPPGQPFDMGALLKQALSTLGGRGGGSKDMAQGGFTQVEGLDAALQTMAAKLNS